MLIIDNSGSARCLIVKVAPTVSWKMKKYKFKPQKLSMDISKKNELTLYIEYFQGIEYCQ